MVGFRLDRTGKLLSTWLKESSGIPALDTQALAIVERAQPFPAPPADMDEDTLRFTLPVKFLTRRDLPRREKPEWERPGWEGPSAAALARPSWLGPPLESPKERPEVDAKIRSICRGC